MQSTQNGQVINYPKRETLKLGSLFDGSGGFPLAAKNVGITPVWASEIEPFPILVTKKNLPTMKHLGDIARIKGGNIPPVDIISFGSPCQDLSVSGKRKGLEGERSGLFFQATRIIKEMRKATSNKRPRYAIWENVPGALSSNKGKDFHAVLQELTSISDKSAAATIPCLSRWPLAGTLEGDSWSIAWRILDAQHFGVPQQRCRIFAVCDFAGHGAPKILFEAIPSKQHSQPRKQMGEDAANTAKDGVGGDRRFYRINTCRGSGSAMAKEGGVAKTLTASFFSPNVNQGGNLVLEPTGPRTITPLEAGRLQGFPDDWCENLAVKNPSKKTVQTWIAIWESWDQLRGVRRKTETQVRKWLASPTSDSAIYKLWGNGVALPVVQHILANLVEVNKSSAGNEAQEWTYSHPA